MKDQILTKTLTELEKEIKQLKKPNLITGGAFGDDDHNYGIQGGLYG